ncbi:MAG: hypothetical protein Q7R86_03120 [bacterium]|nr:hypothetical protein [bacterium]
MTKKSNRKPELKNRNYTFCLLLFSVFWLTLFSIFYFRFSVAEAQETSAPRPEDYENNFNELLSPITDSVSGVDDTTKSFIKRLLEIDFSSIWDGIKKVYEFVSTKFEDITGIQFKEALKWFGNFVVTVLEVFVKFVKWLLSFVNT